MIIPTLSVVINRKSETSKTGLYPIYLRITIDRESKYYKIEVPKKISYKDWNGADDNWVKSFPEFGGNTCRCFFAKFSYLCLTDKFFRKSKYFSIYCKVNVLSNPQKDYTVNSLPNDKIQLVFT